MPLLGGNSDLRGRGPTCGGCGTWLRNLWGGYAYANQAPGTGAGRGCINWNASRSLSTYEYPAAQYLVYDGSCDHGTDTAASQNLRQQRRHNDGWNVGYLDGHVKWQREYLP